MTPRLLSDAVSRVLTEHGLEVVVEPDERALEDCDVVVTSHSHLPEESGVIVTVLPGGRSGDRDASGQAATAEPARVRTLGELVAAIRVFIDAVAMP